MDRFKLAVVIAIGALSGASAEAAVYTATALNLPASTPDAVRDQVARSLASTRDRVGWALYPFRGEFHGLGAIDGLASFATDLSANGRVVTGYDPTNPSTLKAFVWSPATGTTYYNMLPSSASGGAYPTTISADGVYVGGNAFLPSDFSSSGFRWSLAGSQRLSRIGWNLEVTALSANGSITVGTARRTSGYNLDIDSPVFRSEEVAYRFTPQEGARDLPLPEGYTQSTGVDISANGRVILGKVFTGFQSIEPGQPVREDQPILWTGVGTSRLLGGFASSGFQQTNSSFFLPYSEIRTTDANALSADGRTVVGVASLLRASLHTDVYFQPLLKAVLWREETGWIDLGKLKSYAYQLHNDYEATGVSGDGSVVIGRARSGLEDCANYFGCDSHFVWDEARGMRELADVFRLDYGLDFAGWTLGEAAAISDDGTTIIGSGRNPSGQAEAWRAVLHRNTPDGDIDFDGDVDQFDYATLSANLGANSDSRAVFYADGDLNSDGLVDQMDANSLLGLYQHRRRGDFNADGRVDLADFTMWRDHNGHYTGGLADATGDGWVNAAGLALWRANFGSAIAAIPAQAVPEPSAAWLLLAAAFAAPKRSPLS